MEMKKQPKVRDQRRYMKLAGEAKSGDENKIIQFLELRYKLVADCFGMTSEQVDGLDTKEFGKMSAIVEAALLDFSAKADATFRPGAGVPQAEGETSGKDAQGGTNQ